MVFFGGKHSWLMLMLSMLLGPCAADVPRPNILWLVLEDTSPHFIGAYGNESANTPNFDRLASEGIRFTNAFSTGTVCSPSRSTIITGVRTFAAGTGNHRSTMPLPDFIHGFPYYLRQAGYYTTNNAKTDYNTVDAQRIVRESWDEQSSTAGWWGRDAGQPFFAVFNFDDSHQSRTMTNPYAYYEKQVLADLPDSLRVDAENITVPPFLKDDSVMRKQLARIENGIALADVKLGRVLDRLEADGLLENTIIFCYADHGQGMPRAKANGLDLGHRVPFVLYIPDRYKHLSPWQTDGTTTELVSFEDLAPTLLSLAGATIPDYMLGRAILGKDRSEPPKFLFLSSDGAEGVADLSRTVTNGRFSYTRSFMPFMPELIYRKYFDYSEIMCHMRSDFCEGHLTKEQRRLFLPRDTVYLFDYENDPWQLHNLVDSDEQQQRLAEMRAMMREQVVTKRDVMFLPAYALSEISSVTTPYQYRLDEELYPVTDVYRMAELCGRKDPDARNKQLMGLRHPNPYVRYWAAIGIKSGEKGLSGSIQQSLTGSLNDGYPPVRIVVASVLYDASQLDAAYAVLVQGLQSPDVELAKLTIQMIQYQDHQAVFVNLARDLLNAVDLPRRDGDVLAALETFLYSITGLELHYDTFW